MGLSEAFSKVAMAEAERRRQLYAAEQSQAEKVQRKKVWDSFHAVCEFVPRGPAEVAAKRWADLLIAACAQLKILGEPERLVAMRYTGSDRLRATGMEAAFTVCRLAYAGDTAKVRESLRILIESAPDLDSPFRLFLECIRDNRRLWAS
jgi:hypothetical protein